jgi:cytoskeletal protein CcmA (bactofilin family)
MSGKYFPNDNYTFNKQIHSKNKIQKLQNNKKQSSSNLIKNDKIIENISNKTLNDLELNTNINGSLNVSGDSVFNKVLINSLNISGNTNINGSLNVSGDSVFNKVLINSLNISGNTNINGSLNVSGDSIFNKVSVNSLNISGNTNINGSLNVSGDSVFNKILVNSLNISGNTNINGSLNASGDSVFNKILINSLNVSGNTNINGSLNVSGDSVFNKILVNSLNISGNTTINGSLDVSKLNMTMKTIKLFYGPYIISTDKELIIDAYLEEYSIVSYPTLKFNNEYNGSLVLSSHKNNIGQLWILNSKGTLQKIY